MRERKFKGNRNTYIHLVDDLRFVEPIFEECLKRQVGGLPWPTRQVRMVSVNALSCLLFRIRCTVCH